MTSSYVSNILLCGDKTDFYARTDPRRPINIVGQINFSESGNFTIADKSYEYSELPQILQRGGVLTS